MKSSKRLSVLAMWVLVSCKGDMAPFEKLTDEVCACPNLVCTDEKMAKIAELAKTASAGKSDKELKEFADRVEEQRGRMKKCVEELRADAGAPTPPEAPGAAGHGDDH